MISVMILAYGRQEIVDITIPLWLKQVDVDYEIVVGVGPNVKIPPHPLIRQIKVQGPYPDTPQNAYNKFHNQLLKECQGDVLLITQSDMQVTSPTQLKRMLDKWEPGTILNERFFKSLGQRDRGLYTQFMMVAKKDIEAAGGWCELYDNPESIGHEDGDLMACLLEHGLNLNMIETPEEEGVYHISHPRPNYDTPEARQKLKNGDDIFFSRHKTGVMKLYTTQMIRVMMAKRVDEELSKI